MKEALTKMERDGILVHFMFVIACVIVLSIPFNVGMGVKLLVLVVIYNGIIPLIGTWRKYDDWVNIWIFSIILSVFQVWPDWFLAAQLEVLVFPEDGFFKIGAVSAYMAGLWAIPFFLILFIGIRFKERYSQSLAYIIVGTFSLIIFGLSEMTMWSLQSWHAQNVTTIFGHLALYIIVPEVILGVSTYHFYEIVCEKSHWMKILSGFVVMLLYMGSVSFFYFLFEKIIFNN